MAKPSGETFPNLIVTLSWSKREVDSRMAGSRWLRIFMIVLVGGGRKSVSKIFQNFKKSNSEAIIFWILINISARGSLSWSIC
jgi:hypothetical protein